MRMEMCEPSVSLECGSAQSTLEDGPHVSAKTPSVQSLTVVASN